MPLKKFRLEINIVCGGKRVSRSCDWPAKLNVGEYLYIEPDMVARVTRVTHFMQDEPWWEVVAIPWNVPFPFEDEEETPQSESDALPRMRELVTMTKDLHEAAKEKYWIGRWEEGR